MGNCFSATYPDFLFDDAYGPGPFNGQQNLVCNVDPSLSVYALTFGVSGYICQANYYGPYSSYDGYCYGEFYPSAIYTGLDNQVTTATAPAFTIQDSGYTTIYPQFTDVPYSSIAPGSPVTLAYSAVGTDTCEYDGPPRYTTAIGSSVYTQDFSSTLFFVSATTTTSTATVPSLSTTTSTVTNTGIEEAPTATVIIESASGTATSYASASTTTSTYVVHSKAKTKTIIVHRHTTTHASCLPRSTKAASVARRVAVPQQQPGITVTGAPYEMPYCGTPFSSTTYYEEFDVQTTTVTSGVSTETDYTSATATSTYTPTATEYETTFADTTTITPTLTLNSTRIVRPHISTKRRTIVFTTTHYPPHATKCRK